MPAGGPYSAQIQRALRAYGFTGGGSLVLTGDLTVGGVGYFANGSAPAPSIAQASDPDNGIFFGTNQVRFATAGVERWTIGATGVLTGAAGGSIALAAGTNLTTNGGGSPTAIAGGIEVSAGNSSFTGTITLNSRFSLSAGGSTGLGLIRNAAETAGVGVDVATDAVLKIRTRAHTGYATVDALAYQVSGVAGASFGPGVVTNLTVVNGIVTAAS